MLSSVACELHDSGQMFWLAFLPEASHRILLEFWPVPRDRTAGTESALWATWLTHTFSDLPTDVGWDSDPGFVMTATPRC